jgi:uncharacterized protein
MSEITIPAASQRCLINLSRRSLETFVRGRGCSAEGIDDPYLQSNHYGAFVSLHACGELRGCSGRCTPDGPLFRTVVEMTEAAASRDHRVEPVSVAELEAIRIEISVLSSMERAEYPLALQVGKHGLYIESGGRRGLLLPQVALERGWDIREFLEETCRKAGLKRSGWQDPATLISSFTTLVIEEEP